MRPSSTAAITTARTVSPLAPGILMMRTPSLRARAWSLAIGQSWPKNRPRLTQQRDKVLIGFDAIIGPIGQVHSISADCDVHVPLITTALFLPVLGEIKNACSMGPTRAQLVALGPGPMRVEGAFRIWFEGHDEGIPFREEDREVPAGYDNSGPPHVVEVHPITRVGDLDLLDRVRFIERNGVTLSWKTGDSFEVGN